MQMQSDGGASSRTGSSDAGSHDALLAFCIDIFGHERVEECRASLYAIDVCRLGFEAAMDITDEDMSTLMLLEVG